MKSLKFALSILLFASPTLSFALTKTGGSTLVAPDDGSPMTTGGTGVAPAHDTARSAREELRNSGTASTGGTGTTMDDAGGGSTSNTTGTGEMGSDSGAGAAASESVRPSSHPTPVATPHR